VVHAERPQPRVHARLPSLRSILTAPLRPLPNLLVVGAQKAGTTSLHELLSRHPGICMSRTKECDELARDRPSAWRYRAYFPVVLGRPYGGAKWIGESTPYYLFHPAVPTRARDMLPGVHAIAVLRDPVERAWSHYRHSVRLGFESLPFREALEKEPARLASSPEAFRQLSYFERGCYAPQLRRWFDAVGRERVLVLDFEGLVAGTVRGEIERFLGLAAPLQGDLPRRNGGSASDGLMPERERGMLRERFAPHVAEVERLLGRNFEAWR